MRIIVFRFGITCIAISMGIGLISAMTFMGKASSGPIDDFVTDIGTGVSTIENKLILDEREKTRSQSLEWLNTYRVDQTKLNHPDKILVGAYDNKSNETLESIVQLENALHTTFPLISIYTAWGSKSEHQFPAAKVKAISDLGSIPVITWEPWLTSFDPEKYPLLKKIEERDVNGLKSVAGGDYDTYIKKWAKDAAKYQKPIFLRLGHEMNDPYRYPWGPQNNTPEEFVAAWKHIVTIFNNENATNIIWVWSPHPAYGNFTEYYPGDEYVDWIGTGVLNYGTVATWSQWWSFDDMFGNFYKEMTAYKKPIMITELGCLSVGGNKSDWYSKTFQSIPVNYPNVKSVIFYHCSEDNTTTNKTLSWYIKNDSTVTQAITKSMGSWSTVKK